MSRTILYISVDGLARYLRYVSRQARFQGNKKSTRTPLRDGEIDTRLVRLFGAVAEPPPLENLDEGGEHMVSFLGLLTFLGKEIYRAGEGGGGRKKNLHKHQLRSTASRGYRG